jgi:hypothetical protein
VEGGEREWARERMDKFIDVPLFLFKLLKIITIKMYDTPKSAQTTSIHVCAEHYMQPL